MTKHALILGGGGFIGWHLTNRLKHMYYRVTAVGKNFPKFSSSAADQFILGDVRDLSFVKSVINTPYDEIYQLAADMGGAGYINEGKHDAVVVTNNIKINTNVLECAVASGCKKIFFSSSACVYNSLLRQESCSFREENSYPAMPENEYGWEKLFSERLYSSYNTYYGMNNKIARFHNIYGEYGQYVGGREKALAALCRKVAHAKDGDAIEIWGTGTQTRSFLHVDDCVDGIIKLMQSEDFNGPVNIGSDEMISISELVDIIIQISKKQLTKQFVPGPMGISLRNSDNTLIKEKLNWTQSVSLINGLERTYNWINSEISK